ncbi:hypothetical protein CF70_013355 [Cupriavidus sp. SK-3]|nr:hypothetical protein CF70_013355 [Cupriavidus sp. SK-3]
MLVQGALFKTIGATGDDGLHTRGLQVLQDRVRIVDFVDGQTGGLQFVKQRQRFGAVPGLAAGRAKAREHTQSIDQRMNPGGQSATRAADRLTACCYWDAPVAWWWARTTVLSMKTSSKSASPPKLSKHHVPQLRPRPYGKALVHTAPRSEIGR